MDNENIPQYSPGLYAVRHIDNWDGERDVSLSFAKLDAAGKWTHAENGTPHLEYKGDKVLKAWPLEAAAQPALQVVGVQREWLEEWATELVHSAQDGGTMYNQIENLLVLHPKG